MRRGVPLWFARARRRMGYGMAQELMDNSVWYPDTLTLRPIGASEREDALDCVIAAVRWAGLRAARLRMNVTGPRPSRRFCRPVSASWMSRRSVAQPLRNLSTSSITFRPAVTCPERAARQRTTRQWVPFALGESRSDPIPARGAVVDARVGRCLNAGHHRPARTTVNSPSAPIGRAWSA